MVSSPKIPRLEMRQPNVIEFNCIEQEINKVVVFNDRAEITRTVQLDLQPGENEIHIQRVTASYIADSLRVSGRGEATIHEIQTKDKPALVAEIDTPKVAALREQLEKKFAEGNALTDAQIVFKKRLEALDKAVMNVSGGDQPLKLGECSVNEMRSFHQYYEEQAVELKEKLRKIETELKKAEAEVTKLQNELKLIESPAKEYIKTFIIGLESPDGGKAELDVNYQVYNATWSPSYELRVDSQPTESMKITYYGQISQSTGEDWKNVSVVLSTGKPSQAGELPFVGIIEAKFSEKIQTQSTNSDGLFVSLGPTPMTQTYSFGASEATPMVQRRSFKRMEKKVSMGMALASEVQEQVLSTEFTISRPALIPTGGEQHKVVIGTIQLKPLLLYETIPKKDSSVFLTALAINESQLPLLAGPAAVYMDNCFISRNTLKAISPGERFTCSLGIDPAIRVNYKPTKRTKKETGLAGFSQTTIHHTEQMITLTNTRKTPVLVTIKEQIPRSTDERIKVKVLHPSEVTAAEIKTTHFAEELTAKQVGTTFNTTTNILEWTLELKSGEIHELLLKYTVEHPLEEDVFFRELY